MKRRIRRRDVCLLAVILLLVVVIVYSGLQILEATVLRGNQIPTEPVKTKTITRGGVEYFPRQDITPLLILGIDSYGVVEDSQSYQNTGAADLDLLLVFNESTETYTVLSLNRDTMVEMPVLGVGGKPAGTYYGQLALAHTYGSGLHDSAENARQAISDLLYGIRIDYYAALRMDAVTIINDAVGGVTVNVTEDFSAVDPSITMGLCTLRGQQAVNFVRSRQNVGDQLNLSRMDRQKEYLRGFEEALKAKREADPQFLLTTYEELLPYMVTDCSETVISNLLSRYEGYECREIISPAGENLVGEKYMEFHLDEEKFDELVLRLFYEPKE